MILNYLLNSFLFKTANQSLVYSNWIGEGRYLYEIQIIKLKENGKSAVDPVFDIEVDSLLNILKNTYGYDFSNYSRAHVKRRIMKNMLDNHLMNVSQIQERVLHDEEYARGLLYDLSIRVTEMFRDPDFYHAIRIHVIPFLKTWSHIRIWNAGCSTGEEVYSLAILLKEEGLYDRVQIYATDFNQASIDQAKTGIYTTDLMKKYARNYQNSGSTKSFSDYFYAEHDMAILDSSLKKNIIWANHNLVTDSDFAEMHMILCRNVMIYFNRQLQNRVHGLFHNCLVNGGVLCLGSKESIQFSSHEKSYEFISKQYRIYKKKYQNR